VEKNTLKNMKKALFILSLFALAATACHHTDSTDTAKPVVTITAPTTTGSYKTGADINITGTVDEDQGLHTMSIIVTQVSDGKELFKATPSVTNQKNYTFTEKWKPSVTADTDVKLTVRAADHTLNEGVSTVTFSVKK
jgi:hypothetical protein